jgi:hypothetical protein
MSAFDQRSQAAMAKAIAANDWRSREADALDAQRMRSR